MPKFTAANVSKVSAKNINTINFGSYLGVVNGNIFPETPYEAAPTPPVYEPQLDFSVEDNSQYLPLI